MCSCPLSSKTLRILLPNGKAFEFVQNKKADPTTGSSSKPKNLEGIPIESASKSIIRNESGNVKKDDSAKSDTVKKTGEICIALQMSVSKSKEQMNGYAGGYYKLDITEFVATDEWLEAHGVEPGTSYKDYLLSFSENTLVYEKSIHFEQMEKARSADSGSAGLAASHINNRASKERVPQNNPGVKENDSAKSNAVKLSVRKGETAEKAISYFGRTYSWKDTGYLLTDGAKLDFSGRHEGVSGGYSTVDHWVILDVYPEDTELNGNGVMVDYVFQGNIRIMPECNGINLQVQPTKAQEQANGKFVLLYANKKEALSLLQRAGHQLSGTLIPHDGFYHSIREKASPVKPKFNDVTETQQFRKWFGDWLKYPKTASKIVDTDGTPKVMYQGTTEPSLCPRVVAPRWTIQRLCIAFMLYIKQMVKFTS